MSNRTESKTKAPAADIKQSNVVQATDLETLRLPELQARFAAVVGETSKSPNRKFLIRRIQETLAAQALEAEAEEALEPVPQADAELAKEPAAEGPNAAEEEPEGKCPTYGDECVGCGDCEPTEAQPAAESAPPAAEPTQEKDSTPVAPAEEGAPADAAAPEPSSSSVVKEKKPRGRFAAMSITDLQALYTEKVGRSTGSDHRGYLIWKIREAEKGRITVGPVHARKAEGEPADMKILPLRLETNVVETMDAAWRERGIKTRMEFFRKAIGAYLTQLGATEAAALFAAE